MEILSQLSNLPLGLQILLFIVTFLVSAGVVIAGIFAIAALIKTGKDICAGFHGTRYEKDYHRTVSKLVNRGIYVQPKSEIIGEIIVDEGRGGLNTTVRKWYYTKWKKLELEKVLIQQFPTETERIAFLIKQAVREVLNTYLLKKDLMEAFIVYVAYKFAHREKNIVKSIEDFLMRELAKLKYGKCLIKFDSSKYEKVIVLNEEPKAQPLLEENIIPIIGIQTSSFSKFMYEFNGDHLESCDDQCKFFTDWLGRLCNDKVRIIWIGSRRVGEYLQCLKKNNIFNQFNFFIFGARRDNIDKLNYFATNRLPITYSNVNFNMTPIEGDWIHHGKLVHHKWIFCHKLPQKSSTHK